jgi:hypothetical protein
LVSSLVVLSKLWGFGASGTAWATLICRSPDMKLDLVELLLDLLRLRVRFGRIDTVGDCVLDRDRFTCRHFLPGFLLVSPLNRNLVFIFEFVRIRFDWYFV